MKRIVVCCDGTWNKPGMMDRGQLVETNVEKMFKAVRTENPIKQQVKFYGSGVGTSYSISEILLGGGTGMGIDRNIQDAYKFLMWNYEPGDELYFFGFSRGAYTVRSLAGLIRNCGIMKPEYLGLVSEAYHLYRDRTALSHPDSDTMKGFKKSYGIEPETSATFIGVWDTVGALGIPLSLFNWWNRKYQFHDVKLSGRIKYAYHAIAMDEHRRLFKPALWEIDDDTEIANGQICEQVWFPGSHGNIGGGYLDAGLSNIALRWMVDKAREAGMEFYEDYVEQQTANAEGELRNSLSFVYRMFGQLVRGINDLTGNEEKKKIKRNERIHLSAVERYHLIEKYYPKNLEVAVKKGADFDPIKDRWKPEWLEYLTDFFTPNR